MADDFTPDGDDFEPDVAPRSPTGKVPSPTGWREPGKRKFSDDMADMNKQNEAMWSALASGAHGPAMAMEGPVNGAWAALKQDLSNLFSGKPGDTASVTDAYRKERDRIQGAQKENTKRFPLAPAVGALITNPGSAPSTLGRLAVGAGQGALYGLGSSDADLTKNDPAQADKATTDALIGFGIGTGGALLGEALQVPGRWMANRAQGLSDATHAAELAAEQEAREAAVASARGAYGGEVSSGQRILEMVERAAKDPKADPALTQAAQQFLNSPEGTALLNQVLRSNVGRSGDAIGRIQNARTALTDAITANDPALIQQAASTAANAKLNNLSGVTDRLAELARRNIPPAVGGAIGGPVGTAAGAVVGASMGKPGTIMANMLRSPSMYRPLVKGAALGIGTGGSMSRAAVPLAPWTKFLKEDEGDE
jgi:hypothetical protein